MYLIRNWVCRERGAFAIIGASLRGVTPFFVPGWSEPHMSLVFSASLAVPAHVLVRQVENESVLLNLTSERYFGLDEVGTRMWTALTTSPSIQAAYETLIAEYEVEDARLRQNLEELVERLVANGLLEVRSE